MIDWAGIWETIKNFFISKGWNILGFFAALILGFIVVKVLIKIIRKLFAKTKLEKIAQKFLLSIIKFLLWLVYIIMLLSILGVSITGIIAALSAAVLAVGLALQSSLSHLANGIIIVSGKMFKEGDYVNVNGVEGKVKNINLLATTILTNDNKTITIPNSNVVNNPLTNYTAEKKRRVDLQFDVSYDSDILKAKKIIFDVVKSDGRIYLDPEPFCKVDSLKESSVSLTLRAWCDTEDYWDVYFYLLENIFNEFKRNKISIPFNQLEVRVLKEQTKAAFDKTPLPKRVEKVRKEEEKHGLSALAENLIHSKKNEKKANKKLEKLEKENAKKAAKEKKEKPEKQPKKKKEKNQ